MSKCAHFIMAMIACISASAFTLSLSAFLLPALEAEAFPPPAPAAAFGDSAAWSPFPPDFFAKLARWTNGGYNDWELPKGDENVRMRAPALRAAARTVEARTGQTRCIPAIKKMKVPEAAFGLLVSEAQLLVNQRHRSPQRGEGRARVSAMVRYGGVCVTDERIFKNFLSTTLCKQCWKLLAETPFRDFFLITALNLVHCEYSFRGP